MSYKPVDTAIVMVVGPCIDDGDFKSLEESIAYDAAGMDVSLIVEKADNTSAVTAITLTSDGVNDWTHKDGGYYEVEITDVQNAEEGISFIRGICTGVLPFESPRYEIVPANIYDSLVKGTDYLQVDALQISGEVLQIGSSSGYPVVDAQAISDSVSAANNVEANIVNLDESIAGLNNISTGDVSGEAGKALASYDPPTNAEMEARTILSADYFDPSSDTVVDVTTVGSVSGNVDGSIGSLATQAKADVSGEAGSAITSYDPPTKTEMDAGHDALTADLLTMKQTSAGAYDRDTDSLEAIRNRGDSAWTTGGGGSISDILNIQPLIPNALDLADTATVRISLGLTNMVDDLPSTDEITPGTITIDRKAIGGTSWSNIVNAAACSELAGLIYYDEVFDSGSNYAEGDTVRITFKNQKITVAANDYEITGSNGWIFHTYVRETMRGTDSAALATGVRLSTQGKADVSGEVGSAMTSYNPPTKTEMDAGFAGLNDLSASDVSGELSSALSNVNTAVDDMTEDDSGVLRFTANALEEAPTGGSAPTVSEIRTEMDDNSTKLTSIDNKTTNLPSGPADQSAVEAAISTSENNIRGADSDTLETLSDQIDNCNITTPPTAGAIADQVWDEILTGATHNIATSAGKRLREIAAFAIHSGTAQAGSSITITLDAGASANNGVYNRNLVAIVGGTGVGQTRQIADYAGLTKVALVDREWRINPDATTEYVVTANNVFALVDQGQVVAATETTVTIRPYASSIDDTYLCNQIVIIAGTGRGQSRLVGGYNGTTKVITICGSAWVTTPDATSAYVLLPYGTTCTSCVGTYALGLIKSEAGDALTDYDPPTRTEATSDKAEIIVETDAIKAKTDNLPSGIAKNVALPYFDFYMVLSSDHVTSATGKTVTGQIKKDSGSFADITNAITEVSSGMYQIASGFTQTEMNANVITLKFVAADCDQRIITIHTS